MYMYIVCIHTLIHVSCMVILLTLIFLNLNKVSGNLTLNTGLKALRY